VDDDDSRTESSTITYPGGRFGSKDKDLTEFCYRLSWRLSTRVGKSTQHTSPQEETTQTTDAATEQFFMSFVMLAQRFVSVYVSSKEVSSERARAHLG
jgi:hypothetical protein